VEGLLSTQRWRIAESEVIDWREWGDEFVVHVATRSETHLLGAAAGSILLVLLDGRQALTLDAMYATAIDDAETSAGSKDSIMSAAERESLQAIVVNFERLGILTRTAA
jgi:hypothetical protein